MGTSANLLVQHTNVQCNAYYVTEAGVLVYVIDITSNKNMILVENCMGNSNEWLPISKLLGARKIKVR